MTIMWKATHEMILFALKERSLVDAVDHAVCRHLTACPFQK